jgi:hypothetical protein
VSTVQVYDPVPAWPTASVARTSNAWLPSTSPVKESGDEQAAYAAPSRLHSKVAGSFALKEKLAPVLFVGFTGAELKLTTGVFVSTVHV